MKLLFCVQVENSDRMTDLVGRVLEKHLIEGDRSEYCLVQLLENGGTTFSFRTCLYF